MSVENGSGWAWAIRNKKGDWSLCHWAGRIVEVVSERNTTRTCSFCGALSGPAGADMLAVRSWDCEACGTSHDRDTNAAANILRIGLGKQPPLAGTLS